jgi:hypothetical protein
MKAGLKDWWSRWLGYTPTFTEKDDGLYSSRLRAPWYSFIIFYGISLIKIFFFPSLTLRGWHFAGVVAAYALIFVLLVKLAGAADRRRFGPLGQHLAQVDQDTLTLFSGNWPPSHITVALPKLRAMQMGEMVFSGYPGVICEGMDGQTETMRVCYHADSMNAVIDFLRRKLPASVHVTFSHGLPPITHPSGAVRPA